MRLAPSHLANIASSSAFNFSHGGQDPMLNLRKDRETAISVLCEEYPKTFFIDPKRRVPLKYGIEKDIEVELTTNKSSKLLDYDIVDAIEWYCSHVGYKRACSTAGNSRIDLHGAIASRVTEAEARTAEQEATEIFAEIEARKRQTTLLPRFITQPLPPQPQSLPVDTNLNSAEMLQEIEKQIALVRTILGDSPNDPLRQKLARPALRLMIDELSTIIARTDNSW
jgi:hypothetical protein